MKPIKALTLILALSMLIAPILVLKPAFAVTPVNFEVQPVAIAPLTDINGSIWGLETPAVPNPTGQYFNVTIHLTGATVNNVAGLEVHFNFSNILPYATPITFGDTLGMAGGVLNGPILETITGGLYNDTGGTSGNITQYLVAAAGTGAAWNGADGVVAWIKFKILGQPSLLLSQPDFYKEMLIGFTDLSDNLANPIAHGVIQGTLHIDASPPVYPPPAHIFITPTSFTGPLPLGATFNYTVMITADSFWDIAGFDITVTWNSTLMNLVAYSEGGFLNQGLPGTFTFFNVFSDHIQAISTKLANPIPSAGTDSLLQLEFNVTYVSASFPGPTAPVTLGPTDLASWAHPERIFGPWFGSAFAVDIPLAGPDPWDHTIASATYTAPVTINGPNVDLYDQYPLPYGGQGQNQHSDSFAPQAEVCLYAKVTYGGDRVTNKLVSFEVDNALGQKLTILQNYSDINGIATVCFRIPQTDLIPGGMDPSIFGWWNITATVELDQVTVNDTMAFQVGWQAQVTGVSVIGSPYHKYTDLMNFTATVQTIHEQAFWALISVDSYDNQGYPIGENAFWVYINATRNTCPFTGPSTTTTGGIYVYPNLIQGIPTWARVGTATVIGYALTDFPRFGGTPYGPQSPTTSFGITYP
jgi:hypothetical protein